MKYLEVVKYILPMPYFLLLSVIFCQCKDLIRIVKVWSNTVAWRNSSSRPTQYLLSLLVTAAYQVVLEYVF